MGLGRSSYRKASKRIAAFSAANALSRYANTEDYSYLDEDDEEWTTSSSSKRSGGGNASRRSRPSRAKTASNPPLAAVAPTTASSSLRNQHQQPQHRPVVMQQGMALRSSSRTSAVSSASDSPQVAQDARSTTSSPGVECLGTFSATSDADMHVLNNAVKTRGGSRRCRVPPPPAVDLYEFKDEDSPVSVNM